MKSFAFLILASFHFSSAAQLEFQSALSVDNTFLNLKFDETGVSRFDTLGTYFQTGTLPTQTELTGSWAGRCYSKLNDTPASSLLAARELTQTSGQNEGPLFPPVITKTFNVALVVANGLGNAPDIFDNLSPQLKDLLNSYLLGSEFRALVSNVENGSRGSKNDPGNLKFVVRKYQNYFLVQSVILRDEPNYKAGEINFNCYYFKKVN